MSRTFENSTLYGEKYNVTRKKKKRQSSMGLNLGVFTGLNLGVFSSIQRCNHKAFLLGLVEDICLRCTGLFVTEQQPG